MNEVIGLVSIFTGINIFCWFVIRGADFTFKKNFEHVIITEICLLLIVVGSYFLAGGK